MLKLIKDYKNSGLPKGHGKKIAAKRLFVHFHQKNKGIPKDILDIACDIFKKDISCYDSDENRKVAKKRGAEQSQSTEQSQILFIRHVHELVALGVKKGEAIQIAAGDKTPDASRKQYSRMNGRYLDENEEYVDFFYDHESDEITPDLAFQSGEKFSINMEPLDLEDLGNNAFQKTIFPSEEVDPNKAKEIIVRPGELLWESCLPFIEEIGFIFIKPYEVTALVTTNKPNKIFTLQSARFRHK